MIPRPGPCHPPPTRAKRAPRYTERDRENLRWLWSRGLQKKAPWLLVMLGMILLQGVVYQQFLSMTESGLRVIFDSGSVADLIQICIVVFILFAVRGLMSYLVPRLQSGSATPPCFRCGAT